MEGLLVFLFGALVGGVVVFTQYARVKAYVDNWRSK